MQNFKNKYILEINVLLCGAVVMIFELVGARILGPYFGTSLFIWTSLIGVILGSLSFGYWLGGKLADQKADFKNLSFIVFTAALFIVCTILIKKTLLQFLQETSLDIRTASTLASLILFAPTSLWLGMVSPYTAKLKVVSLKNSGATIGNLYAISTIGSILGTFFAGFYLIPSFGINNLLLMLALVLFLLSFATFAQLSWKTQSTTFLFIFIIWGLISIQSYTNPNTNIVETDTAYNHINLIDTTYPQDQSTLRTLFINNEYSSAMFLENDDLVYQYTKYYHLAKHFNPEFKKTLMLGGAGYSYPKDFLKKYPQATIDVVEIDPALTTIATQYFNLKPNSRMQIFHEDGRVYLNKSQKKYDVIFGDAFSSQFTLPYQLSTQEAIQKKYDLLTDNGVVILNTISSIEGQKGLFLRAEYATFQSIFPQVYLLPVQSPEDPNKVQNIILVALKSPKQATFENSDKTLNEFLGHLWKNQITLDQPILTDDYAPVDYYTSKSI